jgi:hypothetical protein
MEPERPIEKELRDFAKKRREEAGAPFELHPATRRLLQGEVARQFGKNPRARRTFLQALATSWPKLAWGAAVVGLMAVIAAVILPGLNQEENPATLAKNERILGPAKDSINAPAPGAAGTEINGSAGTVELASKKSELFDQPKEASTRSQPAQVDNSPLVTLAEPRAGEKSLLSPGSRRAEQGREDSKIVPPTSTPTLAEADRKPGSDSFAPSDGLAGNLRAGGGPTAAPAPPSGFGGALPANSLAENKLLLERSPTLPTGAASATVAGRSTAESELMKRPEQKADNLDLVSKSLVQPPSSATLALNESTAENRFRYYADDSSRDKEAANIQRFTQVATAPKAKTGSPRKSAPAQNLLASFQVEQNGGDLRILDQDGSVYSGYIQAGETLRRLRSTTATPEPASDARLYKSAEASSPQTSANPQRQDQALKNYFFRVAGTNRTFKQQVVFSGSFFPTNAGLFLSATNRPAPAGNAVNEVITAGQRAPLQATPLPPLPLSNSRISGNATINNQRQIEINAVPAAR